MATQKRRRQKGEGTLIQQRGIWYFRHPAIGKRSLRTTDRSTAEDEATKQFGDIILAWKQNKTAQALVDHSEEASKKLEKILDDRKTVKTSLVGCWDRFIKSLPVTVSESKHVDATDDELLSPVTVKGYKLQWNAFVRGMAAAGIHHVEDLSRDAIIEYFGAIRKTRAVGTYNSNITGVGRVLEGAIGANSHMSCVKRAKKRITHAMRPLTVTEFKKAREAAEGWKKPAIDIGFSTALRLGDIVTMQWAQVDMVGGFIFSDLRKTSKGKAFYCPESMPALEEWRRNVTESQYIFPRQAALYLDASKPGDATYISRDFCAWIRELLPDAPDKHLLGFSSIRKTAATMKAAKTGDRQAAANLLGHSSQAVTNAHYIKPTRDQLKELALAAANPLANITDEELVNECRRRGISAKIL